MSKLSHSKIAFRIHENLVLDPNGSGTPQLGTAAIQL